MKWRNDIIAALIALPLIGLLAFGFGRDPHAVPFALRDKPAPDFTLHTLSGATMKLSELRGKLVVINFWASWCEPCKYEHDMLQQASSYYGETVQFVGIVYQDTEAAVRAYLEQHASVYPHLLDPTTSVAIDYGISGVPETYLVDRDGVIREKSPGVISGQELRRWLDNRMGGS
jgi:cytochrome c biogenesis protein CcmG/thiol:disulfide interchange protein DsbE